MASPASRPNSYSVPTIIFIHGTCLTGASWQDCVAALPSNYRTICIDLPGHGSRAGQECTLKNTFTVLDEAIASAIADGKADGKGTQIYLVGHSLGGYFATCYAENNPNISGLMVIGATAKPNSLVGWLYRGLDIFMQKMGSRRMEKLASWSYKKVKAPWPAPTADLFDPIHTAWTEVYENCSPHQMRNIHCPVWLVNGQFDQMRAHVKHYAFNACDPHIVTVPKATHLLPLTHPRETANIIQNMVESHE